jgi:tetratricopeptide (TPR) repeat protein/tRNA A-37 threonylcarbamoyl transferase component Bud32
LSENGSIESDLEHSLGELAADDGNGTVAFMETWADPTLSSANRSAVSSLAETIDASTPPKGRKQPGDVPEQTIEIPSRPEPGAPARRPASGPANPAPVETIEIPSQAEQTVQATVNIGVRKPPELTHDETAMFSTSSVSSPGQLPPAPDFLEESQALTLEEAARSSATTDFGAPGRPAPRKARRTPVAAVSLASFKGPREYEILGELGKGGMGVVYKARHRRLNRLVALKMIRGAYADDVQIARFKIEAEAVASLRHPNILQIYDIGESDGSPYVALELLEGGSLSDRLRGTALPPKQAAEWMVPLVLAMDAAHKAGIVHRDLKSANILFSADGIPKITDFGLAKRLETDEGQTHTGQIMGTPSYMAPEQARGDTKSAGPPADIYSLGAMLYEMLTGRPPFKGISAIETVKQVIEEEPVSPSRVQFRVPRDLETICMKCLQKEPRKRYATAKEMADDLKSYLAAEPIKARRTPLHERAFKWTRRHPATALASTLAVAGTVGLLAWGGWYWNHKRGLERNALQHLATVGEETGADLLHAQELLSKNELNDAKLVLTTRMTVLNRENKVAVSNHLERTQAMLADVDKALAAEEARLAEAEARAEVQKQHQRFLDLRKEALYRDTDVKSLFVSPSTGSAPPPTSGPTRQAAEKALAVYGRRDGDDWQLGDLPAALTAAEQAEVRDGFYELLLVLAGAVASEGAGQVDRSLSILESADRLRPEHSRAYFLTRAACLAARNDLDGKKKQITEAEKLEPKGAADYFLTGQQEYKDKRDADAIRHFDLALRDKPDHFWAKCLQAICYLRTLRPEAAKASLNSCVETDLDSAWLYLLRGFASGLIGNKYLALVKENRGREPGLRRSADAEFDEAEADYQVAMQKLEAKPDADLLYMLFANRGLIRFQRGRTDQAAADYQEAIRLKKDPYLAYADLAHVYEQQGKPDLAIDQFTKAIAIKPDWSPLYRGRAGVVCRRADSTRADREQALADLALAINYETPGNDIIVVDHTQRAKLFYADARYEDALKECELALRSLPEHVAATATADADALEMQVRTLLKLRRVDEAIRSCDQAIVKGKKSAVFYELRGHGHASHNDYPGAIRDYSQAIEHRPADPALLDDRGWAYLQFDSPKLALEDFEAAIKLDAKYANAYNGRGTAHAHIGNFRAAVADAQQALQLDKSNPRVIYNAARIYALAAPLAAAEPGANVRSARTLAAGYQDTALRLIKTALERDTPDHREFFWREIIQPDPALRAIRRRLKYEELVAPKK